MGEEIPPMFGFGTFPPHGAMSSAWALPAWRNRQRLALAKELPLVVWGTLRGALQVFCRHCIMGGACRSQRGAIGSVGTHGLCVLTRPQGASSCQRRELWMGCLRECCRCAAADAQAVRPYITNWGEGGVRGTLRGALQAFADIASWVVLAAAGTAQLVVWGTHGLCVLPRPQGASSRQRRELWMGCLRICGNAAAARDMDAQAVHPYPANGATPPCPPNAVSCRPSPISAQACRCPHCRPLRRRGLPNPPAPACSNICCRLYS